jgi:hypothetical protein
MAHAPLEVVWQETGETPLLMAIGYGDVQVRGCGCGCVCVWWGLVGLVGLAGRLERAHSCVPACPLWHVNTASLTLLCPPRSYTRPQHTTDGGHPHCCRC